MRTQVCRASLLPRAVSWWSAAAATKRIRLTPTSSSFQYTGTLVHGLATFTAQNLVGVSVPDRVTATEPSAWSGILSPLVIPNFPLITVINHQIVSFPISDVTWTYGGPTVTDQIQLQSTSWALHHHDGWQPSGQLRAGNPSQDSVTFQFSRLRASSNNRASSTVSLTQGGIQAVPEPSTLIVPIVAVSLLARSSCCGSVA